MLRSEVARRLNIDSALIFALVKEGDTIVECDEDLADGLVLDVFLREVRNHLFRLFVLIFSCSSKRLVQSANNSALLKSI